MKISDAKAVNNIFITLILLLFVMCQNYEMQRATRSGDPKQIFCML